VKLTAFNEGLPTLAVVGSVKLNISSHQSCIQLRNTTTALFIVNCIIQNLLLLNEDVLMESDLIGGSSGYYQ